MLNKRILVLIFVVAFTFGGCFPAPTPPNEAPIITSTPITTATVGVLYTYNVNATDPDGDTLAYSLVVKPSGMTINSATGLIKWTPTAKGDYPVTVKVSDGTLSINQNFTIKVKAVNHAPSITSIPITTATVGVTYVYDVNATDPDEDTLTYLLVTKPKGMAMYPKTGVINWTPTSAQLGNNQVSVKVSDGTLSVIQNFTIKVSKPTPTPINHAPIIYSAPVTTATVGVTYIYDVVATDPDGDILTYSLTTKPSGMAINPANGLIWWVPTSAQVGSRSVTVKVSDGVLFDTQSFIIKVSEPSVPPVNQKPVINSYPITTAIVGETYTYTIYAFDPDDDILIYSVIDGKPIGMTINSANGFIWWIPISTQIGDNLVTVKVSDGVLFDTQSFIVKVSEPEPEPEPEPGLTKIEVDPKEMGLIVGGFETFKVTASYDNGTTKIVTSKCFYASSDHNIAYVAHGIAKVITLEVGTATILISYTQYNFLTGEEITRTDEIVVTVTPIPMPITIRWLESAIRYNADDSEYSNWPPQPIPNISETIPALDPALLIPSYGGYYFDDPDQFFNYHMADMGLEGSIVISGTGQLSGWATYTLHGLETKNDFAGQVDMIIYEEAVEYGGVPHDGTMVGTYTQLKWAYAESSNELALLEEYYPVAAVLAPEIGPNWWFVQYTDYIVYEWEWE